MKMFKFTLEGGAYTLYPGRVLGEAMKKFIVDYPGRLGELVKVEEE